MYETIFSPVTLGGLTLKNRIVFAPTTMGLSDEAYEAKIRSLAEGGCAMIVIGDVPVGKHGSHSLYSRKGFARYQRLCRTAHKSGCRMCAQLHQSDSDRKVLLRRLPAFLMKRISADEFRQSLNEAAGPYITGLPEKKVKAVTASFGPAAQLAKNAGFDLVQIHGDRMCGSFSSSLLNRRSDAYGGSMENRARFAVEAVTAVRKALPTLPIDFKLAIRQENPHYGNAGVLLEELPIFLPLLEKAGVTSFHVALANHSRLSDTIPPADHPFFSGEGCFLPFCDEVRRFTTLPLCGVGGLSSPDFIEEQLQSGRIDCAAMSRQLIADPDWPEKVKSGRPDEIRRCVRCNRDCLGGMQRHEGVHCIYEKGTQTGGKNI